VRRWRREGAHWLIGGKVRRGGGVFYAGLGEWLISTWSGRADDLFVATQYFKDIGAARRAVERRLARSP